MNNQKKKHLFFVIAVQRDLHTPIRVSWGLEFIHSPPCLWLDNSARDIMVLFNEICNSCLCSISKRGPLFSSAGFPKAVTLPVVPNQERWMQDIHRLLHPPPTPQTPPVHSPPFSLQKPLLSLFLLIMIDGPFVPLYEAVASDEDA